MSLTAKDVAEITRLLESSAFDELYLESDGWKLTLRRGGDSIAGAAAPAGATTAPLSANAAPAKRAPSAAAPAAGADGAPVTAPMLGTFYRAPKPGAPPFIEVGSAVEPDSIIGIIEVMKLMNTVRAGLSGTVVAILGQDGALVEYGEILLRVARAS
jgi:acetyl-CoA carboxylase biotin carboxyl carrier protein